jgi:predicted dienelactone hydrolase
MLHRRLAASILLTGLWIGAALADSPAPYHVGATMRVYHPEIARNWRGAKTEGLVTRIWYPIDPSLPVVAHDIGAPGHQTFQGHAVAVDAPLSAAQAKYPLLLLSHGTGGSAGSLDWLGAGLASAGYVVAGVNHPGNNALEPLTMEGFVLWWERALDMSEMLDGVLADPKLGSHIDRDRIGAVGFSAGGYTVLELAGARTNLKGFEAFCASPAADAICHPPEMSRITGGGSAPPAPTPEMAASMSRSGASYRDERIKAAFATAPSLGEAFDANSFAEVHIPIALVAGTADVIAPVKTNIARTAVFLPAASVTMLPGAGHYTFVDVCVPAMVESAALVCKDGPGVDRAAIHARTLALARRFFFEALPAEDMGNQIDIFFHGAAPPSEGATKP